MMDNYEGGVTVQANISWENDPYADCKFDITLPPSEDPCMEQWLQHYGPYGEGGAPICFFFRSSVSESDDADIFAFGSADADFRGYWPGYSTAEVPPSTFFWSLVKMQPGNAAGTVRYGPRTHAPSPPSTSTGSSSEGRRTCRLCSRRRNSPSVSSTPRVRLIRRSKSWSPPRAST
jgi:choline dehydrogenase